jgi:5-methylcytosine-specific restriction endonuclease McrA
MVCGDFSAGANLENENFRILTQSALRFFKFLPRRRKADVSAPRDREGVMKSVRPKRRRLRLDPDLYEELRNQVLRRDSWRCQSCGAMSNLEVHHKKFRSHADDDSDQNLA